LPLSAVRLMAPSEPTKIVAVGINYAGHAGEMKHDLPENPILFIKPPTSAIGHMQDIVYPAGATRVDFEAELGVVIGKVCKNVREKDALEYVFGYCALNDVTERDMQKKDGQWTRAKSFDTFCPFGPYIETEFDWKGKSIKSVLNGKVMQQSNTDHLIFGVEKLISFISSVMTLKPGDVIATGTPSGIGPMQKGDVIEIAVEEIETLKNTVV
jgi:2-keto-4-pentenoate hydratase/2-oxohepta-3-ene-1,7-dioic acid hydratase in catechol pathway